MKIEIWSDTVCPWCYIGLKRLQQALALRPGLEPDIRFLPFELNPDLPEAGMDRREYLRAKFGDPDRFKDMQGRMAAIAAELGIEYHPERQQRMPNTRHSHLLIAAAAATGRQIEIKEAILRAYFAEGRDIGDPAVLSELAAGAGVDPALVPQFLANKELRAAVESQESEARRAGISGVPTFVFERRVGFSGAQPVEVFLQALDQVRATAPEKVC